MKHAPKRAFLGALFAAFLITGCASLGAPAVAAREHANLGALKTELKAYHDSGDYDRALAAVAAQAQAYVETRAAQVTRPALVLDIDETSLSNWAVLIANDFGYIPGGACDVLPRGPCGQLAWDATGRATAIPGTLALFRAARAHNVAVFFISARREAERAITEADLHAIGYSDWAGVALRPDDAHGGTSADFKTGERARIETQGYTIIANVGDQQSDLSGGHSERTFKLPNPYYFIP